MSADSSTPVTPTHIPVGIPIAVPFSSSTSTPISHRKRGSRETEEKDSIFILNAFLDFKAQHGGSNPTPTTIAPLLDAVHGSLHNPLTADQLYNRLRGLKQKYYKAVNAGGPGESEYDRTFFDLAVKAWGEKSADEKKPELTVVQNGNGFAHDDDDDEIGDDDLKEEEEEEEEEDSDEDDEEEEDNDSDDDEEEGSDGEVDMEFESICKTYKYLACGLKDTCENAGISLATLKLAMKKMDEEDKEKAKQLDDKYKLLFKNELKLKVKKSKLMSEIRAALVGTFDDDEPAEASADEDMDDEPNVGGGGTD